MKSLTSPLGKLLILSSTLIAGSALAASSGIYIGAASGASDTHYSTSNFKDAAGQSSQSGSVDSTGFGARIYAGYRFNRFSAVEAGYTHFAEANGSDLAYNADSSKSGDITEYALDVSGKAIWPLAQEVNPYADLGLAYIHSKLELSNGGHSDTNDEYALRYGAGVDFNITDHFAVGASFNRINQHNDIENADLLALNFNYSFQ